MMLTLVVGCAPATASSDPTPQPASEAGPRTIWDGVYTAAQADRGEQTAYANCFSCHTPSQWGESRFLNPSAQQRLGDLFQMIRQAMPMDAPGRLSPEEYVDVIAYMLRLQGAPPGEAELPPELSRLDAILVTPASGS